MKNVTQFTLIILVASFFMIVGVKTFTNEDNWICENGEWIAHGKPYGPKPTIACNQFCMQDTDCKTPMEFLVQSNCPFASVCISNECKVVCPLFKSSCTTDEDCDCSQRGDKTLNCLCNKNKCVSIEAK